jgi:tRNA(Leu) C34 or U34 (ribose-2'-O)-methylase TrmL
MRTAVYTLKSTQRTSMRSQFNVVLIKPLKHQRSNDNVTRASAACDHHCSTAMLPLQTSLVICTVYI